MNRLVPLAVAFLLGAATAIGLLAVLARRAADAIADQERQQ